VIRLAAVAREIFDVWGRAPVAEEGPMLSVSLIRNVNPARAAVINQLWLTA
jgi:hypothetical protein